MNILQQYLRGELRQTKLKMQLFLKDAIFDGAQKQLQQEHFDDYQHSYLMDQMTPASISVQVCTKPLSKQYVTMDEVSEAMSAYIGMCWYCSGVCDQQLGIACPLLQPNPSGTFKLKCVTCSFPCMVSFIAKRYKHNKSKQTRYTSLTQQLFAVRHGKPPTSLQKAPAFNVQQQFGGDLTRREYCAILQQLSIQMHGGHQSRD